VSIVVVVAALLRVGFFATAEVQQPLRVDAGQYAQYAENLVEHGVYSLSADADPLPDSFRSPGYPLFLAGCRLLVGETLWYDLALWLQLALSTLTVLLVYGMARQYVPYGAAVAAAVLVALSPHLVVAPAYVLTECLTSFVVCLGLWVLTQAKTMGPTVAGAAILGLAPLCNETLVILPLIATATLWRRDRRRAVAILVVAMLPFACWSVRNQVSDLAVSGSARAVASISHGSYPGMVYKSSRFYGFPYREDPAQPEFGSSWSNLWSVLLPRVQEDPMRYLQWYLVEKPVWLWGWDLVQGNDVYVYPVANSPYQSQPVMSATREFMRWLHLPIMLLACLGAVVGIRRRRDDGTWGLAVLGWAVIVGTLAYLPVIPDPRYLQPLRPVIFLLAALGVAVLMRAFRERQERSFETVS